MVLRMPLRASRLLFVHSVLLSLALALVLRRAEQESCTFLAHAPGSLHDEAYITTSPKNILFEHDNVLVVAAADRPTRYLVFRDKDGNCYEQAEQVCGPSTKTALLQMGNASLKECVACDLGDAVPPLSYIESMIGGALHPAAAAGLPSPERILSVGLGSGALPAWLLTHSTATIDVAELSGSVVAAAPCFGLGSQSQLNLVTADGRKFLESQSDGAYDIIFVDAFDAADNIPCALSTYEFFGLVQSKLKVGSGVFAFNVVEHPPLDELLPTLQKVFTNVAVGTAPGLTNQIVLASGLELVATAEAKDDETSLSKWFRNAAFSAPPKQTSSAENTTLRQDGGCA